MKIEVAGRELDATYSSRLEVGDYIPYFHIENGSRILDIQVKACRYNLLIFIDGANTEQLEAAVEYRGAYPSFIIANTENRIQNARLFYDENVYRLFIRESSLVTLCICDSNLKICALECGSQFDDVLERLPSSDELLLSNGPAPLLVVPNVISDDLAIRLKANLDQNIEKAEKSSTDYKSRQHIHPSKALERELDDKLSKSLLPEIEKVFYSKISHRETYKICRYSADDAGCFGKHRDTIDPHLHRRYALTLVLNDDFEGGGITFPEYNNEVVDIPKNWAVVFPGSLFHKVDTIGVGHRYVVISFFFTEAEARLKEGSERYRFTVQRDLVGVRVNKLTPDYDSL